jgi:hypothetical protein
MHSGFAAEFSNKRTHQQVGKPSQGKSGGATQTSALRDHCTRASHAYCSNASFMPDNMDSSRKLGQLGISENDFKKSGTQPPKMPDCAIACDKLSQNIDTQSRTGL